MKRVPLAPPPFLTGDGFALTPLAPGDERLLAHRPQGGDEILLAARDGAGALLGIVALGPLDWPRREAALSWHPAHPRSEGAAPLALATRYALDELGLKRLDLDEGGEALAPLGFVPCAHGWTLRRPA